MCPPQRAPLWGPTVTWLSPHAPRSQFTAQSALGRSLELQLWGGNAECRTGFGFGRGRSTGVLRGGGDELSSALAEVCEDEAEDFQIAKENLENVEMD